MTFQALLFCPDEKTARVTTQVLTELEFSVEACTEPFAAVKKLMGQHFDAIVVDCDNEQNASLLFKSARNSTSNQASLAVAVVEGQSGVANAFRIGANLVLTKPINVEQAKSTLRVARGLLRKGGEAAKPAGNTSPLPTSANSHSVEKLISASDQLPSASPVSPRPTAVSTSVAKPSVPAIAALKAPPPPAVMTKSQPEGAKVSEVQKPAPTTRASEPDLFESSVASAPAVDQSTSSQQYPWQSVLKGAGTSLQRPAAGEEKKEAVPAPKEPSVAATTPTKEARPAFTSSVLTSGGAASAPAPAREAPKPTIPTTAWEAEQAVAMVAPKKMAELSPAKPAMRPPVSAAALAETPAASAPTFSALDSSQEASASAASKKGILVAAGIVLLGVAGYFGYAKFYGGQHSAKSVAASQVSPAAGENSTVEPSVPPPSAAAPSATVVATPLPTTKSQPAPTPFASSKTSSAEESDVTVSHPDAAPALVVKSGGSAKPAPKAEPANDVAAPNIGMNNDDQGTISNIVQSTTVAVPKVAAPQQTLKVSQGVTQGLLTKRVQPVYPPQAMQMHIQGAVQMLATISKEGKITSVKVLSGDPILSRAATDAVIQWRYKPYFLNNEPVEIQTQIVVNFKLP
jgi:protein TonB